LSVSNSKYRLAPSIAAILVSPLLLLLGWIAAHGGVVPILGLIAASLAPTIFLAGLLLVSFGVAFALPIRPLMAAPLAVVLFVGLGLNTRLPDLMQDLADGDGNAVQVITRFNGAVGQPIHIVSNVKELTARYSPSAGAFPACAYDSCLATKGFRTPYPWLRSDYWREDVAQISQFAGFTIAADEERAPTLSIQQETDGVITRIRLQLTSADGVLLSRFSGRYRNGHRYETADGIQSESPDLVLEYLLHSNMLNRAVARHTRNGTDSPLYSFLQQATTLSHPQLQPDGRGGPEPATATLEVLKEKIYEEPLSIDAKWGNSKWSELVWDEERDKRCHTMLKDETDPNRGSSWTLFVNDPSGRKKIRRYGQIFCDPDVVWILQYDGPRNSAWITKYSANGDLLYQIKFDKPAEPRGYPGALLKPSFRVEDGYLQFEWWNSQQGRDVRLLKRRMSVRIKEPV